jgi:catechol 2,3-dioxygenase-like lactoylglutathione lyase family enzyme
VNVQISAVTIGVHDLKRAKQFYEALGCQIDQDHPGFVSFKMGDGSANLSLYKREALAADAGVAPGGTGFAGVVLSYIVSGSGRVDEVLAQAERGGGTVVKRGQKAQWGGYFGHFSDPDGYLWKVAGY